MRIAVIGKLVADEVLTVAESPVPGSQQRALSRTVTGGGQVWHTTRALRRLGVPVTAAGVCGNDLETRRLVSELEDDGIRTRFSRLPGSLRSVVLQQVGGERTIVSAPTAEPGPVAPWDATALLAESDDAGSNPVSWLHLDGFVLDDYGRGVALALARAADAQRMPISMDAPTPAGLPRRRNDLAVLPRLELLVGRSDEVSAVVDLLAEPPTSVATHDGPRAVCLRRASEEVRVPVPPAQVDTLGAGDRFTAGLLSVLAHGGADRAALEAGIRAAQE